MISQHIINIDSLKSSLSKNKIVRLNLDLQYKDQIFPNIVTFFNSKIANFNERDLLNYLSFQELQYCNKLESDFRKNDYIQNNICSKYAISYLSDHTNLKEIEIFRNISGKPYIIAPRAPNLDITIASKKLDNYNISSAIAFDKKFPLAIDLEYLKNDDIDHILSQLSDFEIRNFVNQEINLILLWSAKEALSKIIGSGFYADLKIFEILNIIKKDDQIICYFKYFSQYQSISYIVDDFLITILCFKDSVII